MSRQPLAHRSTNAVSEAYTALHTSRLPFHETDLELFEDARNVCMDENNQNEDTQSSLPKSDDSNISNLSLLDNDNPSDEFERRMLEHARWKKRNALKSDPVRLQPFGKAKARQTLASRMGEFGARDEVAGSDQGILEDSPAGPRDWAKKGRKKNDFLRRLTAQEDPAVERHAQSADHGAHTQDIPLHHDKTGNQDELDKVDADTPLPSIENDLPLVQGTSNDFAFQNAGDDIKKSKTEYDSITTSAFAVKQLRRDNAHVQDELYDVESRAVATNRLGQMRRGAEKKTRTQPPAAMPSKLTRAVTSQRDPMRRDGPDSDSKWHQRKSSRDLLKQLARVSSSTPSPKQGRELEPVAETPDFASPNKRIPTDSKSKNPLHTGSWRVQPRPARSLKFEPIDAETPHPQTQKTPIAIGAWVDTPGATKPVTTNDKKERRGKLEEDSKTLSKVQTALETKLQSGDYGEFDDALEESTIASLKDLVAQEGAGDLSTILELDEDTLNLVSNVNIPVRQGEELRSEEKEALRRMNQALRSARTGLRNASKGIRRVEHRIEQAEKDQNHHRPDRPCEHCGCNGNTTLSGLWYRAWAYYLSFYFSWPKNGRLRLTWLGLFALILTTWMTTEFTLCEIYCQPIYAKSMVGFGVDMNAPRIPYVAYTILVERPFGWIVRRP